MRLTSSAFTNEGIIPARFTCDAEDINPPLSWQDAPAGVRSFALVVDDPDAPLGTWTHWTLWNMPSSANSIGERQIPPGSVEGKTSFGRSGWGGPCPPSGTHRYFFRLYALDTTFESLSASTTVSALMNTMKGHVMATAELMGRYQRIKK